MFKVRGKVLTNIDVKEGVSSRGNSYVVSQWLVDIGDGSGKQVLALKAFNDIHKIIQEGELYNFEFYINTRQYNDRWYTELNIKSCELISSPQRHSDDSGCTEYRPGQESVSNETETSGEGALIDYLNKVDQEGGYNDLPF